VTFVYPPARPRAPRPHYAERLRADIRAAGWAAIDAHHRGNHDLARAHLARERELIEELRRLAPEHDLRTPG